MRSFLSLMVAALAVGCGHVAVVEPAPLGRVQIEGALGGPMVRVGGRPLPVPLTTLGARYGFAERLDVAAHAHLTSLAFGVGGLDVGGAYQLLLQDGGIPALTINSRLYGFASARGGALALLALSGCFALDGFLYTTQRLEAYAFEADGGTPETTVSAEQIRALEIPVEDGDVMGAVFVRAAEQPARASVLYFQGQGGNIEQGFRRIKRLVTMGFDVLAVDYRGWGGSTNIAPTEASIQTDARVAREFLVTTLGAREDRLVYYGRSFGSAVAVYLSTLSPPEVLILESPIASIEALGTDSSGLPLPPGFYANSTWDSEERVKSLDTAQLILHGVADDYVRIEFGETLHANAREPRRFVAVEGADHGDVPEVMGARYAETIRAWVDAHLP